VCQQSISWAKEQKLQLFPFLMGSVMVAFGGVGAFQCLQLKNWV